jgi:hypothetical protein
MGFIRSLSIRRPKYGGGQNHAKVSGAGYD